MTLGVVVDWESVQVTLAGISGKWDPLILDELRRGPRGRNRLRNDIPQRIPDNVFTESLKRLERHGLVEYREIRTHNIVGMEYALTCLGGSLLPILESLSAWGERHAEEVETARHRAEMEERPGA